jgi:replicative DNA helicase
MIADVELECEVLAGAVVGGDCDGDNESFARIALCAPDCFHHQPNRQIFEFMSELFARRELISMVGLRNRHEEIGVPAADLERVWNWNAHGIPDRTRVDQSIRRLTELRAKRIVAASQGELVDERASLAEIHARLEAMGVIVEGASPITTVMDGKQVGLRAAQLLDGHDATFAAIPTGLGLIDFHLDGGLSRGHLVVVGAATGGGKTLLMTNIAANALKRGDIVAYISQELTTDDMIRRLLGLISGRVVTRNTRADEFNLWVPEAIASWGQRFRMESTRSNVAQVAQIARMHSRSNGSIDLLVIDHIQITPSDETHQSRQRELAHISERLSALAKELNCVVLTGSQLTVSKGDVATSDNTREAKDIAHNARVVLEIKWTEKKHPPQMDIRIDKNTMGPSGKMARYDLAPGLVLLEAEDQPAPS